MKIASARVLVLRIPLQRPFSHNLAVRHRSESVVVQLTADTGETGFGEGAPRAYVTGETAASCVAHIERVFLPAIFREECCSLGAQAAPADVLAAIDALLPARGSGGVLAFHAAKCAVELAWLDLALKHAGQPFGVLLPPCGGTPVYSAVIGADDVETARATAAECVRLGLRVFKVKVGQGDDYGRVAAVRELAGEGASLRVDANGAFDEAGTLELLRRLAPLRIESIEQPVQRGDLRALARVRAASAVPVMVDESLVTERDAAALIAGHACDSFNLRLSKNGGVQQTRQLAAMARAAGLGVQVGCQVGETAILAAAGLHLAAHLPGVKYLEGAYGRRLLQADVSRAPVEFGPGGLAPGLSGPGLGVEVCADALQRYAVRTLDVPNRAA